VRGVAKASWCCQTAPRTSEVSRLASRSGRGQLVLGILPPRRAPPQAAHPLHGHRRCRQTPRSCSKRVALNTGHRHRQERLEFLDQIDRNVAPSLKLHLVMDNGSSHTSKATKNWLVAHPRFVAHYTPKHASWVNMVSSCSSRSLPAKFSNEATSLHVTTWSPSSCATSCPTMRRLSPSLGPTQGSRSR